MQRFSILCSLMMSITGCNDGDEFPSDATMLAVGDSFLDWHSDEEQSIPDVVGQALDEVMGNASISGSMVLDNDEESIPNQYHEGPWSWVLINGGGNDLTDRCDCRGCGSVMNKLLSADGQSGKLRDLTERAVDDNAQAVIVGYMNLPDAAEESPQCNDELVELRARKALMADTMPDVIYVDASEAMDGTNPALYDTDHLHPSVRGSRAVGQLIAETIRAAEAMDTGGL